MRKATLNLVIDLAAWVVMLLLAATGLVMRYALPPGSGGRGGGPQSTLWQLGRHDWGDVHFWLSVAIAVLVVAHLALHWDWLCAATRRSLPTLVQWPTSTPKMTLQLYGMGLLVVAALLTIGFVWWGEASVVTRLGRGAGHAPAPERATSIARPPETDQATAAVPPSHARGHDGHIQGYMTLEDVADVTGLPIDRVRSILGITEDTPNSARIGRHARDHGLTMAEVRSRLLPPAP